MKGAIFNIVIIVLLAINFTVAQSIAQELEVDGVIVLDSSATDLPREGMIRWNGSDFEGYTGSAWVSLTNKSVVSDIDGNLYNTVAIGSQVWLSENLRTTKLNTGELIPLVEDNNEWINMQSMAYSWFQNNQDTLQVPYGAYYNFFTIETNKLCPTGWHVPTRNEWEVLRDFLGDDGESGNKLKAVDSIYWIFNVGGASNAAGFNAYPAGFRSNGSGDWFSQGWSCQWHSSDTLSRGWIRSDDGVFSFIGDSPTGGAPVRCVQDSD